MRLVVPDVDVNSPVEIPKAPRSTKAPARLPTGLHFWGHFDCGCDGGKLGNCGFVIFGPEGDLIRAYGNVNAAWVTNNTAEFAGCAALMRCLANNDTPLSER